MVPLIYLRVITSLLGRYEQKQGRVIPNITAFAYSLFWRAARGNTLGISIAHNSCILHLLNLLHQIKSMGISNEILKNEVHGNKQPSIKHFTVFFNLWK